MDTSTSISTSTGSGAAAASLNSSNNATTTVTSAGSSECLSRMGALIAAKGLPRVDDRIAAAEKVSVDFGGKKSAGDVLTSTLG